MCTARCCRGSTHSFGGRRLLPRNLITVFSTVNRSLRFFFQPLRPLRPATCVRRRDHDGRRISRVLGQHTAHRREREKQVVFDDAQLSVAFRSTRSTHDAVTTTRASPDLPAGECRCVHPSAFARLHDGFARKCADDPAVSNVVPARRCAANACRAPSNHDDGHDRRSRRHKRNRRASFEARRAYIARLRTKRGLSPRHPRAARRSRRVRAAR